MSSREILDRTRTFVMEQFLYARPDFQLSDEEPLFEHDIVDSMGVVELIQFLEDAYDIEVQDDEVTEQNFCNLSAIAAFVSAKRPVESVA